MRVIVASLSSRAVDGVKYYIIQDVNVLLFPWTSEFFGFIKCDIFWMYVTLILKTI